MTKKDLEFLGMTLKDSAIAVSLLQKAMDALDKKKHARLADQIEKFFVHLEGGESPWRTQEVKEMRGI